MASIKIANRLNYGNKGRKSLSGVKLKEDVKYFKQKIEADLNISEDFFGWFLRILIFILGYRDLSENYVSWLIIH